MMMAKAVRTIGAPVEAVFETVANGGNYGRAIPEIVAVEFVTPYETGVGARFREIRRLTGWKAVLAKALSVTTTESEVTEFVENRRVRYVTDDVGAYWHSVFTVTPLADGRQTRLEMVVETHPHSTPGRLVPPLLKGTVRRGIESDLDHVKAYIEGGSP